MSRATPNTRDFAERLIAYETRENNSSETKTSAACLVGEKLRPHLATLMGTVGFRALLSRALALANAEVQWLRAVHGRGCNHHSILDVSRHSDDAPVPSLGPRLRCERCGHAGALRVDHGVSADRPNMFAG